MRITRFSPPLVISLLFTLALLFSPATLLARPDLKPLGKNIADTGSAYYQFETHFFNSAAGERRYKVWIGIPEKAAPSTGYPVLYMLDGNAAMARLSEPLLKQMFEDQPPVLVAVGYDTNLPFDVIARSYDYTPTSADPAVKQPLVQGRKTGGSQEFRQFLLTEIIPYVEKRAPSDPSKRAIWGHSFGGLFVLDTFYNATWFHDFFAAAPSLGWGDQRIVKLAKESNPRHLQNRSLYLMEGDGVTEQRKGHSVDLKREEGQLIKILMQKGVDLHLSRYPGQTHGQIFPSSLMDTLHIMSGSEK